MVVEISGNPVADVEDESEITQVDDLEPAESLLKIIEKKIDKLVKVRMHYPFNIQIFILSFCL